MTRAEAVKTLRGTGVYLLDVLDNKIRVRMRKSNRIAMELVITDGQVADNSILYLVEEANLLNDQTPKERRS